MQQFCHLREPPTPVGLWFEATIFPPTGSAISCWFYRWYCVFAVYISHRGRSRSHLLSLHSSFLTVPDLGVLAGYIIHSGCCCDNMAPRVYSARIDVLHGFGLQKFPALDAACFSVVGVVATGAANFNGTKRSS